MEGLEEALTFIDSHLLQQSDEEEDVEEKQLEKCEVVREKFVIKEELEIGKTEFLEQDLVLHGPEYEGCSQATDDTFDEQDDDDDDEEGTRKDEKYKEISKVEKSCGIRELYTIPEKNVIGPKLHAICRHILTPHVSALHLFLLSP